MSWKEWDPRDRSAGASKLPKEERKQTLATPKGWRDRCGRAATRLFSLLPLGIALVACSKSPESAAPVETPKPTAPVTTAATTPEGMAKAMDVPMYPGSTAPDGMSTAKTMGDGSTHYELVLATSDLPKKALDWYAKGLGAEWMGDMVAGRTKGGRDVIVGAKTEAGRTLIHVRSIVYAR